LIRIRI